jgi:hypothetical protein
MAGEVRISADSRDGTCREDIGYTQLSLENAKNTEVRAQRKFMCAQKRKLILQATVNDDGSIDMPNTKHWRAV